MYYPKLEKLVGEKITAFREDLTVHDRISLTNYTGRFIYGCRPTGSYLVKLDESLKELLFTSYEHFELSFEKVWQKFQDSCLVLITSTAIENKWVYIGEHGEIKKVSKKKVEEFSRRWLKHEYEKHLRSVKRKKLVLMPN